MVQRVYERASLCSDLKEVIVATDDERIFEHVSAFGQVVMTSPAHPSGTDRCLEALDNHNASGIYGDGDAVINIQGDEPFIHPGQISQLARMLGDTEKQIVTLARQLENREKASDPNMVKVVFSDSGRALYFSRYPIPFVREKTDQVSKKPYQHIGLYGFRIGTLRRIAGMPAGSLEEAEKLEQLRWMQQDLEIFVEETYTESISVDTPEDLRALLERGDLP